MPEFSGANCYAGWVAVSGEKGIDPMVELECLPGDAQEPLGHCAFPGPRRRSLLLTRGGETQKLGGEKGGG